MNDELKPCPLCSGPVEIDVGGNTDYHDHEHQDVWIECEPCGLLLEIGPGPGAEFKCSCCHDLTREVIRRWNTRVSNNEI